MSRPLKALINPAAINTNIERVRHHVPGRKIIAVVKADAYGHGLRATLAGSSSADAFAVTSIEEAVQVREIDQKRPVILLEGFFEPQELELVERFRLWPILHSEEQLAQLCRARVRSKIHVWIKYDSGMNRLGFRDQELHNALNRVASVGHVTVRGIASHFSSADDVLSEVTSIQYKKIKHIESIGLELSTANSAAIFTGTTFPNEWVRPGIAIYGCSPIPDRSAEDLGLTPAMTMLSSVISIRHCQTGDAVGYGATWTCPEAMRVGVVAGGYADGYPRHAPAGTPVLVEGRRAPLIGRVCMDMLMVDLRDHPSAHVGSPVMLWGEGLLVAEVAERAGTIPAELLARVNARVPREIVEPSS